MIQSYISIGLKSGMKVQYVRDVVADTYGKDGLYYGYGGAGYQDLGIEDRKVSSTLSLEKDEIYYFNLSIDGKEKVEYAITPTKSETNLFKSPYITSPGGGQQDVFSKTYIVKLLNAATLKNGARWLLTNKGDIRCQSISAAQGTSIALSKGTTGKDLLVNIEANLKEAVAGDQLLDQTSEGQIYKDYEDILSDIEAPDKTFLSFPENEGKTTRLIRKNNNESSSGTGKIITTIPISSITEIAIVERTTNL